MHVLGFTFFLAAFVLAMIVMLQMLAANRERILEALLGIVDEPEANPPAQIYHFPSRVRPAIEWREAA